MLNHRLKIRQARAARNLLRLRCAPEFIHQAVVNWVGAQNSKTGANISGLLNDLDEPSAQVIGGMAGRLVLSCHYGFYPAIYLLLAQNVSEGRVAAIIGEQSDEHAKSLKALASSHGIMIDFIKNGAGLVRDTRNYILSGKSAVLLVDVPWSPNGASPDMWHSVPNGQFGTLKTLARLTQLIDPSAATCFATQVGGKHHVENIGGDVFASAFEKLSELLITAPQHYERLDSFDDYYLFDYHPSAAVAFMVTDRYYCMDVTDGSIWDLTAANAAGIYHHVEPPRMFGKVAVAALANLVGKRLDFVIAI